MYLTTSDETEILLRTMFDLEELVMEDRIELAQACTVIFRLARHHQEYPPTKAAKQQKRDEEIEAQQKRDKDIEAVTDKSPDTSELTEA